ncbi:pentapeptide repeat-containing protein [[Leptolyngbya] sp. PCC 7376]|uniref:pentapeptide repeat-containing protein n=1 Tax=[Leptolyngbya] sp. PCC 7376 TaxID=111781 RepID=UPI0003154E8B|nr:pentapeptide repeat-containing protein [[Leptolyngbya] sp. PCC 7376]
MIYQLDDREQREEIREWTIGLLFPIVVGVGGYWLNQQSEERANAEQEQAQREAKKERESREKLAKQEREEQREQADLKYYFDRISTLVVENKLAQTEQESETYHIARALTANILRELSTERMNQVMFFLRSLKLTGYVEHTDSEEDIQLEATTLSVLKGIELNDAELENLNAARGNFEGANLQGANLQGANLTRANLTRAKLDKANLERANLWYTKLCDSYLREANLIGVTFWKTNLNRARLGQANLTGANLTNSNLERAILIGANLERANLTETNLKGASFEGANLTEANLNKTKLSVHLSEKQQKQCAVYDPIIIQNN